MTKKKKKRTPKRIPAVWEKSKAKASPFHTTSGWKLIWGKEGKARVWPSKCPQCGKGLEVQLSGTVCRTFVMEEDGNFGKQTDTDDIDLFYENPTFVCIDWEKCGFEYEVEE